MEGIIPMVYKTIKRNTTRRQYKPLSSSTAAVSSGGASAKARESYDINNFYPNGYNHHHHLHYATPPRRDGEWNGHRRHKSFNFGNSGTGGQFSLEEDSVKPKQLVRFRSHRMFSCITGA
ncbi:hypothetical protein LguiA_028947 [Lonicera macranthoides]